ncbi:AAA family ATPase [Pseudomonas luteola]
MIISARVIKNMSREEDAVKHFLVKPIQSLTNGNITDFGTEHFLVSGPVIKNGEHIAFKLKDDAASKKHHFVDWIIPSYWLTTTYVAQMMQSNILSALPDEHKKAFVEMAEKDKNKNAFRAIADLTPDEVSKRFGIKAAAAKRLILQVRRANNLSMEYSLVHSLRIFPKSVDKLVEIISGNNGIDRSLTDPYSLFNDNGMTFKLCDLIGSALKVDKRRESRMVAAVKESVNQLVSNGNSAFNMERILKGALGFLGFSNEEGRSPAQAREDIRILKAHVNNLVQDLSKIGAQNVMSTYEMYEGDAYIGKALKAFVADRTVNKLKADVSKIPQKLNAEQRQCIFNALENRFSIITGGPGTGKTTVLKAIVDQFPESLVCGLCAPTGKAARRISESSGMDAETIHSMLGFNPGGGFKYNKRNPLPHDVIVVDEFSMVDSNMFRNLLDAIKPGARLLMVGDSDQVPSVDVGNVLQDLLDSGMFAVTRLVEPHRAALDSYITRTAISIRDGVMPDLRVARSGDTDFIFIPTKDVGEIRDSVLRLMSTEIVDRFGVSHDDIQILTPQKGTEIGVDVLNHHLRNLINPNTDYTKLSVKSMGIEYCVGDRVMQTKNNKELGINNGDVGKIVSMDYRNKTVEVDFDGKAAAIPFGKMHEVKHAWAMTVHKSQGSEYADVIMPLSMIHRNMLTRKIVYTGVTRAKKRLWIVGDPAALEHAVKNTQEIPRETALKYIIGQDNGPGNYYHRARIVEPSKMEHHPF